MSNALHFERVAVPQDHDELVDFLCKNVWPFHGRRTLSPTQAGSMDVLTDDVDSYWVVDDGRRVGLIRLLDLGDIGVGAPLIDVRIAGNDRGRGIGTRATRWAVDHLFGSYPELHRIEANTHADNVAMQAALSATGFTQEGRLRLAWWSDDESWSDALLYGVLRTEWDAATGDTA